MTLYACFFALCVSVNAQKCESASTESLTESIGANEIITLRSTTVRSIRGRVTDPNGAALATAIVDVFPLKKSNRDLSWPESGPYRGRVRSYRADREGNFCLEGLPDGDYQLRFGTDEFAFKHVIILVKKRASGSRKPIEIFLLPGT